MGFNLIFKFHSCRLDLSLVRLCYMHDMCLSVIMWVDMLVCIHVLLLLCFFMVVVKQESKAKHIRLPCRLKRGSKSFNPLRMSLNFSFLKIIIHLFDYLLKDAYSGRLFPTLLKRRQNGFSTS